MILYLGMLTIFDSLDQIGDNFFSQEALFMIVLTYLNHEAGIYLLRVKSRSLLLYFAMALIATVLLNSALILVYFIYILGYMHFRTELLTINILFLVFHGLLNLYYLSIEHMARAGDLELQRERDQARQLELELEGFQQEMNPGFLMTCLEKLINLIHRDAAESERYIACLSEQYRYVLDHRHMEITDLEGETSAAVDLVWLLGYGVEPGMLMEPAACKEKSHRIIPGSLLKIVHWIFNHMIIDPLRPVMIRLKVDASGDILVSHSFQPRLKQPVPGTHEEKLDSSYRHYTGRGIEHGTEGKMMVWRLPGIPDIKEH